MIGQIPRSCADGDGEVDQTVNDYFDAKLYSIQVSSAPRDLIVRIYLQVCKYDSGNLTIGQYFKTLQWPSDLMNDKF